MIFKHGIHCVLNILLILRELSRHLLVELFGKSLDDHVGIGNPISIYLHKGSIPFLDRNLLLWSIFWYWAPWIFSQDSSFYGFFFFLLTVLILELHLMLSLIPSSSFNLMICCLQITYVLQILREKAQIIRFQLNHLKELLFMWLYFHCYDKHPK